MKDIDAAYAAGLIDGEGTIYVKKSKSAVHAAHYSICIKVKMTDEGVVRWLAGLMGGRTVYRTKVYYAGGKPLYQASIEGAPAAAFLREILPYLKVKVLQARNGVALESIKAGRRYGRGKVLRTIERPHPKNPSVLVKQRIMGRDDETQEMYEGFHIIGQMLNSPKAKEAS